MSDEELIKDASKTPREHRDPKLDMICRLYNTVNWLRNWQKEPHGDMIEKQLNTLKADAEQLITSCGLNPEEV